MSFNTVEVTETWKKIEVNEGGEIVVLPFLHACTELTKIFDILGSAFKLAKNDMVGNIEKITKAYNGHGQKLDTLNKLIEDDKANKRVDKSDSAACATLWLKRGLEFIDAFLRHTVSSDPEKVTLSQCVASAYEDTLSKHHGFAARQIFWLAAKAVMYRADFYNALVVSGEDHDTVVKNLSAFREVVQSIIAQIVTA
eukprot:GFYU01001039.1.p1 GENE.GFYU01001039.1~~GFYU01001039.1.p1  ORF type:complete len:197 (+),score=25.84 GFYU01001039.1:67-657(+)